MHIDIIYEIIWNRVYIEKKGIKIYVTDGRMCLKEQLFNDNSLLRTRTYRSIDRRPIQTFQWADIFSFGVLLTAPPPYSDVLLRKLILKSIARYFSGRSGSFRAVCSSWTLLAILLANRAYNCRIEKRIFSTARLGMVYLCVFLIWHYSISCFYLTIETLPYCLFLTVALLVLSCSMLFAYFDFNTTIWFQTSSEIGLPCPSSIIDILPSIFPF